MTKGLRKLRHDPSAIGGFLESGIAMMVVTVAVLTFTLAVGAVIVDRPGSGVTSSLQDSREDLMFQVLHDKACYVNEGMLSWHGLEERSKHPFPCGEEVAGYAVEVRSLEGDLAIELHAGSELRDEESISGQCCINIMGESGNVSMGIVQVTVWG